MVNLKIFKGTIVAIQITFIYALRLQKINFDVFFYIGHNNNVKEIFLHC